MSDALTEALGGAIGSCIAFGVTYPLITISTWQSLNTESSSSSQEQRSALMRVLPSPVRNLVQYISEPGGLKRLYAGIQPFLIGTVVSQGLYFYLYATLRGWVVAVRARRAAGSSAGAAAGPSRAQDIGVLGSILVASVAGSINVLATNPVWTIVTKQQNAVKQGGGEGQVGTLERVKAVYREDGLRGFWKGVVPALIMVTNPTIQFILYEWLVARVRDIRRKRAQAAGTKASVSLTAGDAFLLSALAKLGATLATYPMQLIKSRMQATGVRSSTPTPGATHTDESCHYNSVWAALTRIIETEGVKGLFKGMKAKMMQTVLGAALLMAIKEQVYNSVRALSKATSLPKAAAALG